MRSRDSPAYRRQLGRSRIKSLLQKLGRDDKVLRLRKMNPDEPYICPFCNFFKFLRDEPKDGKFNTNCHKEGKKYMLLLILRMMKHSLHLKGVEWKKQVRNLPMNNSAEILRTFGYSDEDNEIFNMKICLFKICLWHWTGWEDTEEYTNKDIENTYNNLIFYIENNLSEIMQSLPKSNIDQEIDNDSVINVVCSLNVLKALFSEKLYDNLFDVMNSNYDSSLLTRSLLLPGSVNNWPFITIMLSLPNLILIRSNYNHNEFKVVNKAVNNKPVIDTPMNMNLYYKPENEHQTFQSSDVRQYIHNLSMKFDSNLNTDFENKEIHMYLLQCFKDFSLLTDEVETNTEYYANLFAYPYMRYINDFDNACKKNNNPKSRESANENECKIALQQITFPSIKFELVKFYPTPIEDDFKDIVDWKSCLIYTCNLCNKVFDGPNGSLNVRNHIIHNHSFEPNYTCYKCEEDFTPCFLSINRWYHVCLNN